MPELEISVSAEQMEAFGQILLSQLNYDLQVGNKLTPLIYAIKEQYGNRATGSAKTRIKNFDVAISRGSIDGYTEAGIPLGKDFNDHARFADKATLKEVGGFYSITEGQLGTLNQFISSIVYNTSEGMQAAAKTYKLLKREFIFIKDIETALKVDLNKKIAKALMDTTTNTVFGDTICSATTTGNVKHHVNLLTGEALDAGFINRVMTVLGSHKSPKGDDLDDTEPTFWITNPNQKYSLTELVQPADNLNVALRNLLSGSGTSQIILSHSSITDKVLFALTKDSGLTINTETPGPYVVSKPDKWGNLFYQLKWFISVHFESTTGIVRIELGG